MSSMNPTNFPSVSMPSPSSTLTMVPNPSQTIRYGIFTPSFSQPTINFPQMGMVNFINVSGGSSVAPS